MTMENLVICLVGLFAMFLVKNQMLKWTIQMKGAVCDRELRNNNEECRSSDGFSAKFLSFSHSLRFGFTLVELLVVIGDYRRVNRTFVAGSSGGA
jgi:hypothetical protein